MQPVTLNNLLTYINPARKHRILYFAVGGVLLLSWLLTIRVFLHATDIFFWNSFSITEFLISFEGGFVRRGLLGECLYGLSTLTGLSPLPIIIAISIAAYAGFFAILLRKFYTKGVCWWLAFTPILLCTVYYVIRKDFLCYLLIALIMWILARYKPSTARSTALTLFCCLGMMLHEAFIFYGFPFVALMMLSEVRRFRINLLYICLIPALFILLSVFRGDRATADGIIAAWNSIVPGQPMHYVYFNSIGALTWTLDDAIWLHIYNNFYSPQWGWAAGIALRASELCLLFYTLSNFFIIFPWRWSPSATDRCNLPSLSLLTIICMLPMLTVLSCDQYRVYQYITVAAILPFLFLKARTIAEAFPAWFTNIAVGINSLFIKVLPQRRWIMAIMILLMCLPTPQYHLAEFNWTSPLGTVYTFTSQCVSILLRHIIS